MKDLSWLVLSSNVFGIGIFGSIVSIKEQNIFWSILWLVVCSLEIVGITKFYNTINKECELK